MIPTRALQATAWRIGGARRYHAAQHLIYVSILEQKKENTKYQDTSRSTTYLSVARCTLGRSVNVSALRGQLWARPRTRLLIIITQKLSKKTKSLRVRRARDGCHPGVHSVSQPVLTSLLFNYAYGVPRFSASDAYVNHKIN